MSLILDALRRAESQRQSQVQPALALPAGRSRRRGSALPPALRTSLWALAVAGVGVGAWLLWPGGDAARPVPPPAGAAGAMETAATSSPPARTIGATGTTARPAAPGSAPVATGTPNTAGERRIASLTAAARSGGDAAPTPVPAPPQATAGTAPRRGAPPPGTVMVVAPGSEEPVSGALVGTSAPAQTTMPGTVEIRDLLAEEGYAAGGASITVSAPAATGQPAAGAAAAGTAVTPPSSAAGAGGMVGGPARGPSEAELARLEGAPEAFTLNMLSTSDDPANSYVYINMQRYGIGDRTREGAVVEDINNRGAVLAYRGQRYLLKLR